MRVWPNYAFLLCNLSLLMAQYFCSPVSCQHRPVTHHISTGCLTLVARCRGDLIALRISEPVSNGRKLFGHRFSRTEPEKVGLGWGARRVRPVMPSVQVLGDVDNRNIFGFGCEICPSNRLDTDFGTQLCLINLHGS